MRTLRHPVFLLCCLLFGLNQALELAGIRLQLLFSYFDDLLALPVVLTFILAAERAYFRNSGFVLPVSYTCAAVLIFSIFFEGIFPLISVRHTADLWDIMAYAAGAVVFHFVINKPLR